MAFHFSPKIVTDGLVFYIDAYNTKSYPGTGTNVNDLTPNQINGTLINGVGFDGKSWSFDGINDYINCDSLVPLVQNDTEGTIDIWLTPTVIPSDNPKMIFGFNDTTDEAYILFRITTNGGLNANIRNNPSLVNWVFVADNPIFTAGETINLTFAKDSVDTKLYVNGELEPITYTNATDKTDWVNAINVDSILIGANNYNTGTAIRHINADFASLKYYNRALSASEVKQNYDALKSRFL